mgnify:FL=1
MKKVQNNLMFNKIKSFFSSVKEGLSKSSDSIKSNITKILKKKVMVDQESLDEIMENLLLADISFQTSEYLIGQMKKELNVNEYSSESNESLFLDLINSEVKKMLNRDDIEIKLNSSDITVILISGVNGSGKTTTVGKLSFLLSKISDKKIMLIAADTFRAAAVDQLKVWSQRSEVMFYTTSQNDPASVVYSGLDKAKENNVDIVIIDTAGRLGTNTDLMNQINKIEKVIISKTNKKPTESLIVLDGTAGQNALSQVKAFGDNISLTGIIVTKLDSTSKAGFAISASYDNNLPIKFIGIGERVEDLIPFDSNEFGDALFK